jgi:ABC-type dipeptide/oligopeptide/nickel transport system permease subunit
MTQSIPRILLALIIAAGGLYLGVALARFSEADDAPGGVLIAIVLILVSLGTSVRIVRRKV